MLTGDVTFNDIVEQTKKMLGENYRGDEKDSASESENETEPEEQEASSTILENICEIVIREAAQYTNQSLKQNLNRILNDCAPVIIKCACTAYLNRGSEGLGSQSELGQQNVYTDWVKLLHQQLSDRRHIL
jgi:hypothetical protein